MRRPRLFPHPNRNVADAYCAVLRAAPHFFQIAVVCFFLWVALGDRINEGAPQRVGINTFSHNRNFGKRLPEAEAEGSPGKILHRIPDLLSPTNLDVLHAATASFFVAVKSDYVLQNGIGVGIRSEERRV